MLWRPTQSATGVAPIPGGNMIKVSVFYPNANGARFDMSYYLNSHMPMVRQKLGGALKGMSVEHGLGGGQPDTPPTFLAMGHLMFESVDAFQHAWTPHAEAIVGDIPNYTNTQPTVQVSEVKL
jgi:uncharacterized protein (TIGR02118 family)